MPLHVLVDTRKLNAPRLAVAAPGMTAGEAGPPSLESFAKVVGPLCLEDGKTVFPSADHVDAPALVLGWWLEVVQALFEKKRPAGMLGFAGGPFEVRITVDGRAWLLDLCERGKRRTVKTPRLKTSPRKLAEALVDAAGKLLASAKKKKLEAPELEVLLRNRKSLQAALKQA
jgi:hypothetical protein